MNDPHRRLQDILNGARDAEALVSRGRRAFFSDPLLLRAGKNIVTEIGEAAKHLGPLADQIPEVPWRAIAGMRDRTVHRYPDVDSDMLWDTLADDLPDLAQVIQAFLAEHPSLGKPDSAAESH